MLDDDCTKTQESKASLMHMRRTHQVVPDILNGNNKMKQKASRGSDGSSAKYHNYDI